MTRLTNRASLLALALGWCAAATIVVALLVDARRSALERGERVASAIVQVMEQHTARTFQPLVAQAIGPRIQLVLELAPGLPPVLTDESQLEIALLNLVVNARDAMGRHGRIALRTRAMPSGEVCLTVEDDGPGMSEEVRLRALEPFFTTKGDAGTGLGLAQVYGFMRLAGGRIELDSAPGKGTRVHLTFAGARPSKANRSTQQKAPLAAGPEG